MCGIVGYVGARDAVPVILDGLRRLEYRGYDSAGIAVVTGGQLLRRRAAGKLGNLAESLAREPLSGEWGLGHTRWATHGRPTEENAHPHQDGAGRIVVVHNGIIENHLELKARLQAQGHKFVSQTDTEVVAHLVGLALPGLARAGDAQGARGDPRRLRAGADAPGRAAAAGRRAARPAARDRPRRRASTTWPPTSPRSCRTRATSCSSRTATSRHSRPRPSASRISRAQPVARAPQRIAWDPVQAEKGGFRHFMLKEIHEQPRAMRDTLLGRISLEEGEVHLEELGAAADRLRGADRAVLLACGTSWHAALVGKFLIEHLAQIPVEVDYGSEFRYRKPLVGPTTLAVAISQSGETADTLGAFREAKAKGALPIAICNVQGSMLVREADGLAAARTPAPRSASPRPRPSRRSSWRCPCWRSTSGRLRGALSAESCRDELAHLTRIPLQMERVLGLEPKIEELSRTLKDARDFLYLGRGVNYPIALEGALKLKEISYLHAEGYPAGEMKHGPIALVDESLPVVALVPGGHVHEKMLSNVQEAKARGGRVIAVGQAGDAALDAILDASRDVLLEIPACPELWSPFLDRDPAAAHRLPRGAARRARRRPAAQPRQVRHGRVGVLVDLASAALAGLNPQQREAVAAAAGPVLILAGAGSGKTRVITHRIAHLVLDLGVPSRQILAVTFTNKAAAEMRARVEALLGEHKLEAWVSTFHSFCVRLLRREARAAGLDPGFLIYDEDDQLAAVREALRRLDLSEKLHPPRRFLSRISARKNAGRGRSRDDFELDRVRRGDAGLPRRAARGERARLRRPAAARGGRARGRRGGLRALARALSATCWSTSTRTRTARSTSSCGSWPGPAAT